ncbi:MAG: 50S ribosomal protein L4 [Candidatus Omnitrophica bacterium]|nr:50S ribosomal protein L4 [Candidatus Omnitrophota bacterium]
MDNIELPIYNSEGNETQKIELAKDVFGGAVNEDAVYQTIMSYNANQRKGLAATKTRGEVSGGGKKPWKQKGTGRARAGSIRSPLWRHGGVVFGPHPRDFSYTLPQKIKNLALKSALAVKLKEGRIVIVDDVSISKPSTKEANKILTNLKLDGGKKKDTSVLLLFDKIGLNLRRSLRNLSYLDVGLAGEANAYEILAHEKVVLTRGALLELTKRLQK